MASANTRTGTSSDVPTLPNETAASGINRLDFARFIRDRSNAAENPACDIASSSGERPRVLHAALGRA